MMKPEDIKILNNFLEMEEVKNLFNDEMKKITEKIGLTVNQILLQEQYTKDMEKILDELKKFDN